MAKVTDYVICRRCDDVLVDGFCTDETCPFSDHVQTCPIGWVGHCDDPYVAEMEGHIYADEDSSCICPSRAVKA
jgi:hypothetical protein